MYVERRSLYKQTSKNDESAADFGGGVGMSFNRRCGKWQYRSVKYPRQDVISVVPAYGSLICRAWFSASAASIILLTEFAESAVHIMARS